MKQTEAERRAAERAKRAKRQARRDSMLEGRSDRYAFITISVDRTTDELTVDHPFISMAEARGLVGEACDWLDARTERIRERQISSE